MWIKICANTSLEDALAAAESGADAVGFIFAPSSRRVAPETAALISVPLESLHPQLERVGVFQSHDASEIARIARSAHLTGIQMHGEFNLPLSQQLRDALGPDIGLIHVLQLEAHAPVSHQTLAMQLDEIDAAGITDRVLIDSKVGSISGGTGVTFDWAAATPLFAGAPENLKLILAGGLRPHNVAPAISQLQPWGVDVATGVEAAPGRKNHHLIGEFIRNARQSAH